MGSAKQGQRVVVQIAKNFKNIDVSLPKLKELVRAICERFNSRKGPRSKGTRSRATVVSIAIVDDAEIRRMNKQFLNRKSTSDCLSFDLSDDENLKSKMVRRAHHPEQRRGSKNRKLFELVVNGEMAVREAKLRGHSSEAELALYVTHGLLHNLGFDDSTKKQAQKMHRTEDEILQQFGYGLVYSKNITSL